MSLDLPILLQQAVQYTPAHLQDSLGQKFPVLLGSHFSLHLRLSHSLTHYILLCCDGNTWVVC